MEERKYSVKGLREASSKLKEVFSRQKEFQARTPSVCHIHGLPELNACTNPGNTLIWRCSMCTRDYQRTANKTDKKVYMENALASFEQDTIQKSIITIERIFQQAYLTKKHLDSILTQFDKVRAITNQNLASFLQYDSIPKYDQLVASLQSQFQKMSTNLQKGYAGNCTTNASLLKKIDTQSAIKGLEASFKTTKSKIIEEFIGDLKGKPNGLRKSFDIISQAIRYLTSGTKLTNPQLPFIICVGVEHHQGKPSRENTSIPSDNPRRPVTLKPPQNNLMMTPDRRSFSPLPESAYQAACQDHIRTITTLKHRVTELEKNAENDARELIELKTKYSVWEDVTLRNVADKSNLQSENQQLRNELTDATILIEKVIGKDKRSFYEKVKSLLQKLEQLKNKSYELKEKMKSMAEQQQIELSLTNDTHKEKLNESEKINQTLNSTVVNLQGMLNRMQQQLDTEKSLRNKAKQEENAVRSALKVKEDFCKLAEQQKKSIKKELAACRVNLLAEVKRSNERKQAAQSARKELQAQIAQYDLVFKKLEECDGKLLIEEEKYNSEEMKYINRIKELEEDIIRRREESTSEHQKNTQLEKALRKQVKDAVKSIEQLKQQTTLKRQSINELKITLAKLDKQHSKLNNTVKQLIKAFLKVAEGMKYSSKDVDQLEKLLVQYVKELTDEEFEKYIDKKSTVQKVADQLIKHYMLAFTKSAVLENDIEALKSNSEQQRQQTLESQRLERTNTALKKEVDHYKMTIGWLLECLELSESREKLSTLWASKLAAALSQTVSRAGEVYEMLQLINVSQEEPSLLVERASISFTDMLADRELRLQLFVLAAQQNYERLLERECIAKEPLQQQTTLQLLPPPPLVSQTSAALESFWSKLLNSQQKKWLLQQLAQQAKREVISLEQKFIASQHRFQCASYHRVCDQLCNLLTIIQTKKGPVLGGFTDLPLGDKSAPSVCSFIFTVNRELVMPLKPTRIATLNEYAYGPIFGSENDIRIDKDTVSTNYHVLNSTYQRVEVPGVSNKEVLMGSTLEDVAEYEVFEVIFKSEKSDE